MAKAEGIHAEGPFPADTIYLRVGKGNYNAVVSMDHDQGQIATNRVSYGILLKNSFRSWANFAGGNRSFLGWYSCSKMIPFRQGPRISTAGL
jgi:hypothetical protein